MAKLIDATYLILSSNVENNRIYAKDIIDSPAIDPVHFAGGTYCKECIYKEESTVKNPKDYWCQLRDSYMDLDGFCSEGRKDDMK